MEYKYSFKPIKLAKYGVPQCCRRLILIASRHGKINFPRESHGSGTHNKNYTSVRDTIAYLPPIEAGETHPSIPNHQAAKLSLFNLKRINATPEGGGNKNWTEHLKLDCHKHFEGYSDVYGRMSWDKPASGLTTRCISYSNERFGHPEQNRSLSIREAACLQTFPEDFLFQGSMGSMARQIGNAIPPLLAKVIGLHFIAHLRDARRLT